MVWDQTELKTGESGEGATGSSGSELSQIMQANSTSDDVHSSMRNDAGHDFANQQASSEAMSRIPCCVNPSDRSTSYSGTTAIQPGERMETFKRKLQCRYCIATASNHLQLHRHARRTHSNEADSLAYIRELQLLSGQHEMVYKCQVCNKGYTSKSVLNRHQLIHKGLSYPCNHCQKIFHQQTNLRAHIRNTHEGDKRVQHKCPHCNKIFRIKGNLTQHVQGVHLRKFAFPCTHCPAGFHHARYLQRHLSDNHPFNTE